MTTTHRIAVIPGDGIGTEVIPQGLRVLDATAAAFDLKLEFEHFDHSSADYYLKHGKMLPDNWFDELRGFDAIFFGAVGWPEVVPDHISLWGSLLQFRRAFDQYVNLRPVRLMPGVPSPLAGRKPGDVDFYVVRENTEGEYSSIGGKIFEGTDRETVIQETVMTRTGVDRILKFAFDLAQSPSEKAPDFGHQEQRHLHHDAVLGRTGRGNGGRLPRRRGGQVPHRHPDRELRDAPRLVRRGRRLKPVRRHPFRPRSGVHGHHRHRASANINPERTFPSLFEPVHGSAPDIAGRGIANPIGQIWCASMMLGHLGEPDAAAAVLDAVETVLARGGDSLTPDMGGAATTTTLGKAVADAVTAP